MPFLFEYRSRGYRPRWLYLIIGLLIALIALKFIAYLAGMVRILWIDWLRPIFDKYDKDYIELVPPPKDPRRKINLNKPPPGGFSFPGKWASHLN